MTKRIGISETGVPIYCYSSFLLDLDFTFSINFLIPKVMAMQSGKYGVKGPAQKAR